MKIALGQMKVVSGQCESNFDKMASMIAKAKSAGASFIVFPELCISGFGLQDKWNDIEFLTTCLMYNEKILKLSDKIGIIFGNVAFDLDKREENGYPIRYNAAYFCKDGKWVEIENGQPYYIKHVVPTSGIFDEGRYFTSALDISGDVLSPFVVNVEGQSIRIGVAIGDDVWAEDEHLDITKSYINNNVDFIFSLSSSPWTLGVEKLREKQMIHHVKNNDHFVPLLYVNACGMQNTGKTIVIFDGGSRMFDDKGKCIGACNDGFKEEIKIVVPDEPQKIEQSQNKLLHALVVAIQDVDQQLFNSSVKWILGLSGGLDSTVNACLLTYALGKDRVIAYNMASQYNSDLTMSNAKKTANSLGIELREGSIEKVVQATIETMEDYQYKDADQGLVLENIQARIRGHLLSTFASLTGGVVINNGNKIEIAFGYCTMYGDSIGALSPLGDCTKTQLFELSHCLNQVFNKEVVPLNLLPQVEGECIKWDMPPSAELKDSQVDPMKWFYHDWLIQKLVSVPTYQVESIMESYLDGSLLKDEVGVWIRYYGLDNPVKFMEDLEWVLTTFQKAIFKRIQLPPVVMISKGSFGNSFRESQAIFQRSDKYLKLKKQILMMKEK